MKDLLKCKKDIESYAKIFQCDAQSLQSMLETQENNKWLDLSVEYTINDAELISDIYYSFCIGIYSDTWPLKDQNGKIIDTLVSAPQIDYYDMHANCWINDRSKYIHFDLDWFKDMLNYFLEDVNEYKKPVTVKYTCADKEESKTYSCEEFKDYINKLLQDLEEVK